MSLIRNKTLSIILVLSLVIGGIPLFFAATDNAEAAVGVWEKRTSAMSIMHSNGKLTVDVSTFEDEGGKPIQGYTLLLKWDLCRKDLNPLSGFWRTIRDPRTATITTDAKGQAEYKFSISNGCWTENLWVYGSSESWQNVEYFLGNIASTNIQLDIQTQASMATQHAMQRADTLGIIDGWYDMRLYGHDGPDNVYMTGSRTFAGAVKLTAHYPPSATSAFIQQPSSSIGTIIDYDPMPLTKLRSRILTYNTFEGTFNQENVTKALGDNAKIYGGNNGFICADSDDLTDPSRLAIQDAQIHGNKIIGTWYNTPQTSNDDQNDIRMQIRINGEVAYPADGSWAIGPKFADPAVTFEVPLPADQINSKRSYFDIEILTYRTDSIGMYNRVNVELLLPQVASLILTDLQERHASTTLTLQGSPITIDLTGHWGEWQISGSSSTLTSEDLVPVNAKISSVYPLVISSPRFDKTPIAGTGNGLKFDVYNIKDQATHETIYLSLIADGTTVWSTTVGQREYPAWTNASQYTSVHLTDITFPAEPRREYDLQITSGGAITKIPVVFYPSELDPEEIYGPKDELDKIIKDYGTVNARALKAYHDWAVSMQPKVEAIKADVENYTKLFEDRTALDNLALADAAATRGLDLIADLKEICKGDGSGTSIGELTSHAQGIWSSYLAALLYRETAIAYEAGQPAFGNSTALDAWYADLLSKRIKTGLDDPGGYDDPNSVAVWVAVAVALVVGGLVMYLCWKYIIPPLKRVLPKGRSPRLRTIRALTPVAVTIVLAVLIALVAFLATWNIAVNIEAALR